MPSHRLLLYEEFPYPQYHQKIWRRLYVFGEFWNGDTETNDEYLESIDYLYDLIDVALHQNLFRASQEGENFDLRTIFDGTLAQSS